MRLTLSNGRNQGNLTGHCSSATRSSRQHVWDGKQSKAGVCKKKTKRTMPMFANTSLNHRVSSPQATASIKRWLFLTTVTGTTWSPIVPPLLSSKLAEPLSTHNFKMTADLVTPTKVRWTIVGNTVCKLDMSPNHLSYWLDSPGVCIWDMECVARRLIG